ENVPLYTIAGWEVYGVEILIATVGLIVFGYLNIKGTGISGKTQFIFAMVMVVSVFILTLFVGVQPTAGITNIQPYFPSNTTAFAPFISMVPSAAWAFVGVDAVARAAEEVDVPASKACSLIIFA